MTPRTAHKPKAADLQRKLRDNGGNVTATAAQLGIHRVTLHAWMREYGIVMQRAVKRP